MLRRPLAWPVVLLLLSAPLSAQEPPSPKQPKLIDAGQFVYLRKGQAFGTERYALYESPDKKRLLRIGMGFSHIKLQSSGQLILGADGAPLAFDFVIERPQGEARITTLFQEKTARCEVKTKERDVEKTLLERTVKLDGPMCLVEEGLLTLDAIALGRYDRKRGGEQTIPVLVAQLGAVHSFKVVAKGEEQVTYGPKNEKKVQATRFEVAYRGSKQTYWLDAKGRLIRCEAKSTVGAVVILRVSDKAEPLKNKPPKTSPPPTSSPKTDK